MALLASATSKKSLQLEKRGLGLWTRKWEGERGSNTNNNHNKTRFAEFPLSLNSISGPPPDTRGTETEEKSPLRDRKARAINKGKKWETAARGQNNVH